MQFALQGHLCRSWASALLQLRAASALAWEGSFPCLLAVHIHRSQVKSQERSTQSHNAKHSTRPDKKVFQQKTFFGLYIE